MKNINLNLDKRGQFTVEFIMIFVCAFFIFLILLAIVIDYLDLSGKDSSYDKLDAFGESIRKDIKLAQISGTEYMTSIYLPLDLDGIPYEIKLDDTVNVLYIKNNVTQSYVYKSLPNVNGSIVKGCNKIHKINNVIYIGPC